MILADKKVLFISPKFFDYHINIIKELEREGAKVTFYPEMEYSFLYRCVRNINDNLKKQLEKKHLMFILEHIVENQFDLFFLIRGGIITEDFLNVLREKLPLASFIMYQWDSLSQNNYSTFISFFDSVKTFDKHDAQALNIKYLPLFYSDKYACLEKKFKKYDLVFFGSWHSDRLDIIKYFYNELQKYGMSFKYHLYISRLTMLRSLLSGKLSLQDLSYVTTCTVSTDEIIKTYQESKAVLDVELSIQQGLTIRTFEVLASKTKLVTTNNNIKEETFYNPHNIMVIDRKRIEINFDFFQSPMQEYDFSSYHIREWLKKIVMVAK